MCVYKLLKVNSQRPSSSSLAVLGFKLITFRSIVQCINQSATNKVKMSATIMNIRQSISNVLLSFFKLYTVHSYRILKIDHLADIIILRLHCLHKKGWKCSSLSFFQANGSGKLNHLLPYFTMETCDQRKINMAQSQTTLFQPIFSSLQKVIAYQQKWQ